MIKTARTFAAALALAAAASLGMAACDQSPIFNTISNETKKVPADVKGTPSKIVSFGGYLYIANGYLFQRGATAGSWEKISPPNGEKVRDIETDGTNFFALTITDHDSAASSSTSSAVYHTTDFSTWTELPLASSVSAYAYRYKLASANGTVYVGARSQDDSASYDTLEAILEADVSGTGTLAPVSSALTGLDYNSEFAGAAYDGTYSYLATAGRGIFRSDDWTTALTNTASTAYLLTGILSINGSTIAVGRGGYALWKTAAADSFSKTDLGYILTGAICAYSETNGGTATRLLAGYKSGTIYGYREIVLSSGTIAAVALSKPNNSTDSSVSDYDQYVSSLGVEPVEHLYQDWSSTGNPSIVYASSYADGLWSSTSRGDWNLDN